MSFILHLTTSPGASSRQHRAQARRKSWTACQSIAGHIYWAHTVYWAHILGTSTYTLLAIWRQQLAWLQEGTGVLDLRLYCFVQDIDYLYLMNAVRFSVKDFRSMYECHRCFYVMQGQHYNSGCDSRLHKGPYRTAQLMCGILAPPWFPVTLVNGVMLHCRKSFPPFVGHAPVSNCHVQHLTAETQCEYSVQMIKPDPACNILPKGLVCGSTGYDSLPFTFT